MNVMALGWGTRDPRQKKTRSRVNMRPQRVTASRHRCKAPGFSKRHNPLFYWHAALGRAPQKLGIPALLPAGEDACFAPGFPP